MILITGGAGFLGINIAKKYISQNNEVVIFDNLYRVGSSENIHEIINDKQIHFVNGDVRNKNDVESVFKLFSPSIIIHVAGQVAMTTSIQNPLLDFETNTLGTINVLEAMRNHTPNAVLLYASTNKVYGDLSEYTLIEQEKRFEIFEKPLGFDETTKLEFHSPYGCSKGSADQYVLDYSRIYNLKNVVLRHSTIYGISQHATYDQGWIGWFIQKAIEQKNGDKTEFSISGDGKQVRDILFMTDAVDCYLNIIENINTTKGQAFNIGGGIENSISILELLNFLEEKLEIKLNYYHIKERESDQKVYISDITKINLMTKWKPKVNKFSGIELMMNWLLK